VFWEAMGKLMQRQAWIRSCFVDRFCRHVYLHSIGTMMGFHAVKLWQNETFHGHNHMNIIIKTHLNSRKGKMEANDTS
jgi:hypothetical protein